MWSVLRYSLLLLTVFSAGAMPATAATGSAVYVEVQGSESGGNSERYKLYGESHALVIGIDNYVAGWPRLSNAVEDARLIAREMEAKGFEVELLLDPDGADLRSALRNFFALKGRNPEARLFLWFAGHGHTDFGEGYLVPADAPLPEDPNFFVKALHMGDVGSMVRIARAKHVFSVFDSCFAGTVFASARAKPPAAVTKAAVQPVRQFLTSGDADQQVSDDGTFRRLFLGALRGDEAADLNGDGYLTGSELGFYLEDRVLNLTQAAQTPRSGKLRDQRFDRGDFIFILPNAQVEVTLAQPEAPAATQDDSAFELAFWDSIKNSDAPEDYEAYLASFPDGKFVSLAEARLAVIARKAAKERTAADVAAAEDTAKTEDQAKMQMQMQEQMKAQQQLQAELEAQRKRQVELEQQLAVSAETSQGQTAALPPATVDLADLQGRWEAKNRGWKVEITIVGGSFELSAYCKGNRIKDRAGNSRFAGQLQPNGNIQHFVNGQWSISFTLNGPLSGMKAKPSGRNSCSETELVFERTG